MWHAAAGRAAAVAIGGIEALCCASNCCAVAAHHCCVCAARFVVEEIKTTATPAFTIEVLRGELHCCVMDAQLEKWLLCFPNILLYRLKMQFVRYYKNRYCIT